MLAVIEPDGSPAIRRVGVTVVAPVPYYLWALGALGILAVGVGVVGLARRRHVRST